MHIDYIGFGVLIIVNLGQVVKNLSDNKVIKTRLHSIDKRLDKQNNRLDKCEKSDIDHLQKFHAK